MLSIAFDKILSKAFMKKKKEQEGIFNLLFFKKVGNYNRKRYNFKRFLKSNVIYLTLFTLAVGNYL